MASTRSPYARLDRFIRRKKEELERLLTLETDLPPRQQPKLVSKVVHLRKVIATAKRELIRIENKLCNEGLQNRLIQLDREHRNCCQRLDTLAENSSLYHEINAERQQLWQHMQDLRTKIGDTTTISNPAIPEATDAKSG